MIAVRPATSADAEALAALRWEFRTSPDRPQRPCEAEEAFLARCAAWMRGELKAGSPWRAWVAEDRDRGSRIVGQIWLQILGKLPNPVGERRCHGYISNVYVQPASRGGAGARLLETVLAAAAADGVDRVLLWPSARSVTLYERHGFKRAGDVMELKL